MANTDLFLAMPEYSSGVAPASTATAWTFGDWKLIHQDVSRDLAIISFNIQVTYAPATAATTFEQLFEIGIGQQGSEVTKIQIPHCIRVDTAVGHFMTAFSWFLPEPFEVKANTRISVRVADSSGAATTFNGVKMVYSAVNNIVEQRTAGLPNNYQFVQVPADMWVGERIR